MLGDTGIIKKTRMGQGVHDQAQELERLELVKATVAMDPVNQGKVSVKEVIAEGITTEEDVIYNEDGSATVTTDSGYVVTVTRDGPNNVLINIEKMEPSNQG